MILTTFCPCYFSAKMHLGVSPGRDEGVPTLEDITDEETEVKLTGAGKEKTFTQSKLKVPQK